jgi:uncharacterized repeat protein (TIGR01451 family)
MSTHFGSWLRGMRRGLSEMRPGSTGTTIRRRRRPVEGQESRPAVRLLVERLETRLAPAFSLGLAANYGVLTNPSISKVALTSDTFITGNIGIANSGGANQSSPQLSGAGATVTGNVDFAGITNITNTTVTGMTNQNVADVNTAFNTMSTLSASLGAKTGTTLTLTGSAQTINASSGTLDANGNRVFTASSGFVVNAPLTINGGPNDYVVINIPAGQTAKFSNSITLTGGITDDHVLYNVLGTGNEIGGAANQATVHGIILGINRKFNMDAVKVVGRVIGGDSANFQLVSNFFLTQPDNPGIQIVKFANGQDADTPTGPHVAAGSTLTFTYVVTNTGNVPLANVVVTDNKLGTIAGPASGDTNGNGRLDVTETWTYTTTAIAQAGQQTNVGTVTGRDANTGATVTNNNPANYFGDAPGIHIVKFVNGQDANTPTGPHVVVGGRVTFTYVVTNTGNVPLASVVVIDNKLGPITSFTGDANGNGLLDTNETWTYTATATAVAGQQTNTGTVTGQDASTGATVTDNNPANYFGDAPGIKIVKFVNGQDADTKPGPHVTPGSTLTFTYVVTNTGNVPLANVVVTDDDLGTITSFTGDTNGNGLLDTTETWTYTATATAQPGQRTNVGTVTGQDANNPPGTTVTDSNPANYFGDQNGAPGIKIVKFVNGQDADTPTGPHVTPGSTLTFTYVVTNTGTVPLANVVVTDDKLGPITSFAGDTNGNGLLDTTETWTYTATAVAVAGHQTNTGTVTGTDNTTGAIVTDNNPANYFGDAPGIQIVKFVNGHDADTAPGPNVPAGSTLTFTYVVTNTGNVPLANVTVTDDKLGPITSFIGDVNNNGLLDTNEAWVYTQTAVALAGQQTNTGTVTGTDANNPSAPPVTDDNPANYFGDAPGIKIVKYVNGQDADTPTGPHVPAGTFRGARGNIIVDRSNTVTFTYVVTNTGNVPLANVEVIDDKLGPITSFTGDTNGNGLLDTDETWIYTATAIAQPGQQTNLGTVTGQDVNNPTGPPVTDNNPANYFGDVPLIQIVKFVNGQDADTPTGPHVAAGSTLTFTYVVTNIGNVPLANVVVTDDKLGPITSFTGDTNGNGLLDLGETWTYTQTATAQPGQRTNTGTVTGTDTNTGATVSDNNPANYFGDAPGIKIVKFVNGLDADTAPGPHVPAGSTLTFTYVVTNTGNVPLANVAVTDDVLGPLTSFTGDTNNNGLLDTNETWTFTQTTTARPGQQVNTGTVTGQDANNPPGTTVTDNNPANYFGDAPGAPGIKIVKFVNGEDADTAPGPNVPAGSTLTFTYVVTNTGSVPLADVVVNDNVLGPITRFTGDTNNNGLLDTNETWTYTATATAQAGQQTNVGTVTGQDASTGATVTDNNPANYFGDAPGIKIVKFVNGQDADTAPGPHVPAGSTVTFTYVVTNTGNVPLANVVVIDDKLGPITTFTGDTNGNSLLDLNETWTYTQSATAVAGQQTNTGTATGEDANTGATVTDNNPANYFGDAPGIKIVKFVNGDDADAPTGPHVAAGSTVTFTYVVTNTGNVPLANVVVTDNQLGPITSFSGDTNGNGLLDLNETWSYTQSATAEPGQQTNTGIATGQDSSTGATVTDNNPANYFGDAPGIKIVKLVNGQDADTPTGPHVPAGSTLTFTYVVTNTGNVPLANVVVTDDKLGTITSFTGDTNGNGLLDTNEVWIYTQTATAQPGQQTNTGTVTGQDFNSPPGTTVTDDNPANYFGDAPAIEITKFVNGQDADTPPGAHVSAGSTLTFTYVVTNTGNVPLANVVVTDDKLGPITSFTGDTNGNGLLDLNETWTFTATAVAQPGQQTNTGTVTGHDGDTGATVTDNNPANYFGDTPGIHIVKFVNGDDADTPPGPQVPVGSTLTFTYVVTNTGNVPLANVVVTDDKLGTITSFTGDTNGNGLLDPTETWTYTATATAVAGQQTNTGTVTGLDASTGATVTDDNPANYFGGAPAIHIVKFVNGDDADLPTGPHVAVGSTLTFTYVVTNVGNLPLSNVVVTDDKLGTITSFTGDTNGDGMLDTNETWTYTATATAVADQQTNTGTVTAKDTSGATVTDSNPANYFGDAPGIEITKFVNGQDADTPTGPHVAAGSTVTFTYVVTNTGNVPLANVVVSDDKLGAITSFTGDTNGNGLLDLGEVWIYTRTAIAQAGQQTNTGTVTAKDANNPPGTTVTDSNPANYFGDAPAIHIVKFVNGDDADTPPGPHVPAGSPVTFTYVVTNTGNVPLANVVVNDDKLGPITSFGGDTNGNGLLDLGETWTYTVSATAVAGQQTNTGTATGEDANTGATVTDNNPANYFGDAPGIHIVKFVNGQDADTPTGPHVAPGSTLTFTYVVTNTGNVPLANVVVTDDKLGRITSFTGDTNGNGLLDLGETWTYTATATAQAGQQTNTGTVTGQDDSTGATVTDNNPANYFGDGPGIKIVKFVNGQDADTAPGPHVAAGSTVVFTYVVTNTGNVPLANVVVTDDKLGRITSFTGDTNGNGLLDTNETWTYTQTATARAGEQSNVGTVTGQDANNPPGTTVTDDNPAHYFGDAPGIKVVKFVNGQDADTPPGLFVPIGSTVVFTYVVTNTGNVPLANVVVTDDKLGPITSFTGDTNKNALLDLGETWTFTATAVALPGQQTNVGTVTGQDASTGATVSDDNPGNYFGAPPADIALTKVAQPSQVMFGENVTFTLIVHNKGPGTATDVFVDDPLPAGLVFVAATASQGTYAPATGIWVVGTLANGATAVLQVTARVAAFGPLVNRAEAGADQFEPDKSNNVATGNVTGLNPAPIVSKRSFLASAAPAPPPARPAPPLPALATLRADVLFVEGLYLESLRRGPKPAELAFWMNELLLGVSRSVVAQRV